FALLQLLGVSFSLVLTICAVPAALVTSLTLHDTVYHLGQELPWLNWVAVTIQALDSLGNAIAALLLSGSHRLSEKGIEPIPAGQARRQICCQVRHAKPRAVLAKETAWSPAWEAKVEELSLRGMTLRSLFRFYQDELPSVRNWSYVPREHKTRDVVRRVIIPLTRREESSYAASALNLDGPRRADVMVTHNWGNRFKDLLAAVIADALQECSFSLATKLLEADPAFLQEVLNDSGGLDDTYWICAFAVNQHICICHNNLYDRDPFTNELHPVCTCSSVNISDPDGRSTESEINKFDDMMYHLATSGGCRQVIAVDQSLDLFNRAWCVAEIAEANRLHMNQALNLHPGIKNNMNIDQFNIELQSLIFDPKSGLLASWNAMDSEQQVGEVGRLIRWGLADAGTGKVWKVWDADE
ncbi:BMY1, partial [Symbiodinium pilosum]